MALAMSITVEPYSETSSGSSSDSDEPPALPPRAWRKDFSPTALQSQAFVPRNPRLPPNLLSEQRPLSDIPTITVSPPFGTTNT